MYHAVACKEYLVVCVTDSAGKARPESAAKNLGDDVFGTISGAATLKSQAFDCSYGQLNISILEGSVPNGQQAAPDSRRCSWPRGIEFSPCEHNSYHRPISSPYDIHGQGS